MLSHRSLKIIGIFSFSIAVASVVGAQSTSPASVASAVPALHSGAFVAVQDSFRKDLQLAKQGNLQAELRVAKAYFFGAGQPRDTIEAFKWFQTAAQQESLEANAWIGECYLEGRGVSRNATLGAKLIQASAAQGDPQGLTFLGAMYENGIGGVELDATKAADSFRRAAELKNANAMTRLGYLYFQGRGVPQDRVKAVELFTEAAALGDAWAELGLAQVKLMDSVSPNYSEIVTLLDDAAAKGNDKASFLLGTLYQEGRGVSRNDVQAALYFQHSAHRGNAQAERELGRAYELGIGVPADLSRAYLLYSIAAGHNDLLAAQARTLLVPKMAPEQLQKARDAVSKHNGATDHF